MDTSWTQHRYAKHKLRTVVTDVPYAVYACVCACLSVGRMRWVIHLNLSTDDRFKYDIACVSCL